MEKNTETSKEGLKFFGINLENFKNISHKTIDIGGHSIKVVGPNGSGKSSLIQAICSPLESKILPTEVIKKGEERAKVEVTLAGMMGGEKVKYVLELFFTQGNQNGRLVVYNSKGEKIPSSKTFIKSLIGNVSFDITAWLHESSEKKLKMLKTLTGCELEIDKINKSIVDKKSSKKAKKERAEEMEAILKNKNFNEQEIEIYSQPKPLEPLQEELKNVSKAISNYNYVEENKEKFNKEIKERESNIAGCKQKIEELKAQILQQEGLIESNFKDIQKCKENISKADEWLSQKVKPSAEEISNRINEAVKHNEKVESVKRLFEQQREMLKSKQDIGTIDTEIEALETQRMTLISKSQLPINGLTFTEDKILIDGLPLGEGQQNTARLFDIGVEVAMALNPNLKVIFLHDASLFDRKNLETIIAKAEARGYQVIAECVAEGELDVKFTETEN